MLHTCRPASVAVADASLQPASHRRRSRCAALFALAARLPAPAPVPAPGMFTGIVVVVVVVVVDAECCGDEEKDVLAFGDQGAGGAVYSFFSFLAASFLAAASDRRDGCHVSFGADDDSVVELGAPNRILLRKGREKKSVGGGGCCASVVCLW